jgi:hypothetical protein
MKPASPLPSGDNRIWRHSDEMRIKPLRCAFEAALFIMPAEHIAPTVPF